MVAVKWLTPSPLKMRIFLRLNRAAEVTIRLALKHILNRRCRILFANSCREKYFYLFTELIP